MGIDKLLVRPAREWAQFAASHIALYLKTAGETHPARRISVALAGGNTPAAVYRAMVALKEPAIDWQRLDLFLGDERMVPLDHCESNYRLARENLTIEDAQETFSLYHVKTDHSANDAAWKYEKLIRRTLDCNAPGMPAIDLVLLGLGSDGHTASLFPSAPTLDERERLVVPAVHPESGQERVTFTLPLIHSAKLVVFLVAGAGKADMVAQITAMNACPEFPASLVSNGADEVIWILDEPAAVQVTGRHS